MDVFPLWRFYRRRFFLVDIITVNVFSICGHFFHGRFFRGHFLPNIISVLYDDITPKISNTCPALLFKIQKFSYSWCCLFMECLCNKLASFVFISLYIWSNVIIIVYTDRCYVLHHIITKWSIKFADDNKKSERMCRWGFRGTEPFRSRANSLPGANRPIGPWPIRSLELSLSGPFAPWPFRFLANSLPGPFVPRPFRTRERKFYGTFVPWNFRSLELWLPYCVYRLLFSLS